MPTNINLASNMAEQQQQQLAEFDHHLASKDPNPTAICERLLYFVGTVGPDWVQEHIYGVNERGEKVKEYFNTFFSSNETGGKSFKVEEYVKFAYKTLQHATLEKLEEMYQSFNLSRNPQMGSWFWVGLFSDMEKDVDDAFISVAKEENQAKNMQQHQPFPAPAPPAAASSNNIRFADDRTEGTFQQQHQQTFSEQAAAAASSNNRNRFTDVRTEGPFPAAAAASSNNSHRFTDVRTEGPFPAPAAASSNNSHRFTDVRTEGLFPAPAAASSNNRNRFTDVRTEGPFPAPAAASSNNSQFTGKENQFNFRQEGTSSSFFGRGPSTPRVPSTPTKSVNTFSVTSSMKSAQKNAIKNGYTGTPSNYGFTDGTSFELSSFTGGFDFDAGSVKMTSEDIVSAAGGHSETLHKWLSDLDALQAKLSEIFLPNQGKVISNIKQLQGWKNYVKFKELVRNQVSLRDDAINVRSNQIANLEGCLNREARRQVGDDLVDERKDQEEEQIRMIEVRHANEVAQLFAQKEKDVAQVKAKFAAEGVEQDRKGKSSARQWQSELDDARSALAEEQQEKVKSLTPAKVELHIFETAFKLFDQLTRRLSWNPATQVFDFGTNQKAENQYHKDCQHLSSVHDLYQCKNWDELESIVWK